MPQFDIEESLAGRARMAFDGIPAYLWIMHPPVMVMASVATMLGYVFPLVMVSSVLLTLTCLIMGASPFASASKYLGDLEDAIWESSPVVLSIFAVSTALPFIITGASPLLIPSLNLAMYLFAGYTGLRALEKHNINIPALDCILGRGGETETNYTL